MALRYSEPAARNLVQDAGADTGEDLVLRIYTSRLLGQDPALVLHGGGNTSVKSEAVDTFGKPVSVLYVKGSGYDLQNISARGFPACRMDVLLQCLELSSMTDEDMVKRLRLSMLDPESPTPSVEALLHAILPGKYVDHTHADAILTLVDQPDSEALVKNALGNVRFLPYVMPGFLLARKVADLLKEAPFKAGDEPCLVLDKHGIFTWGDTAEQSYNRMLDVVAKAERFIEKKRAKASYVLVTPPRAERIYELLPVLRGAYTRASGHSVLATVRPSDAAQRLAANPKAAAIAARGPITPDHVIRTRGLPLVLPKPSGNAAQDAATCEKAIVAFAEAYQAYFKRCSSARPGRRRQLDPYPKVMLVPTLGIVAFGTSVGEAETAADIFEHTAQVIEAAEVLGSYRPVSELDRFDVEYWSLEQAKLGKHPARAPLDQKVALVTGAGSGIGLATARALLLAGAHVVLTDKDAENVEQKATELSGLKPGRVAWCRADVTEPSDLKAALVHTVNRFGGLDIVVSNAGAVFQGQLHEIAGENQLNASFQVNFWGHQNVARAASEVFLAQGTGGVLLFNASKSALAPGPDFGPYAVAKAATVALVRQYAVDLGAHGIRANAVNADRIRTELFGQGVLESRAKARGLSPESYFSANLLGRETLVDDVAQAFVYLATAQGTTGALLAVDGGNPAAFVR